MLRGWRRRYWLRHHRLPDTLWQRVLAQVPVADGLSQAEQRSLHDLVVILLREKVFEGAGDFDVAEEMRLLIAVQACLPILHLGPDYHRGWVEILVYPGGFRVPHEYRDEYGIVHTGEAVLAGEAWVQGPVIVSWRDIQDDLAYPGEGRNVVIHEIAHKLDMLDGMANGLPPLHRGMPIAAWAAAFEGAYGTFCERVDAGEQTDIDPYAATDPGEFFAVMAEVFFDAPELLQEEFPEVYRQLAAFFRQDPARRFASLAGAAGLPG
jgi:MtfA peptidase